MKKFLFFIWAIFFVSLAFGEEDPVSDALKAEKEKSALLKEKKDQSDYEKSIEANELAKLTGGITAQSKPLVGAVEGTISSHIPNLIFYRNLEAVSEEIGCGIKDKIKNKKLVIMPISDVGQGSLVALQVREMMQTLNTGIDQRVLENKKLLPNNLPKNSDGISTSRIAPIAAIGAVSTAVGAISDVVGLFKSEYKYFAGAPTTDQEALNASITKSFISHGGQVLDFDSINWNSSTAVDNYIAISNSLAELRESIQQLELIISVTEAGLKENKSSMEKIKTELAKIQDSASSEYISKRQAYDDYENKNSTLDSKISFLNFAKIESASLKQTTEAFIAEIMKSSDGKASPFYEVVIQEKRSLTDYTFKAAIVGAGGDGYIERGTFSATKLSVMSGFYIRYELVSKDGIIEAAGVVGETYSASYPIKKPEQISVKKIDINSKAESECNRGSNGS